VAPPKIIARSRAISLTTFITDLLKSLRVFEKYLRVENSSTLSLAPNRDRGVFAALGEGQKMKKQEDARLAVLREYDRWAKDHPNDAKKMGGYVFFGYLEKERPDLLNFRAAAANV
jgi:hypothetical protein